MTHTITASCPEDLIAAVPHLLGFQPSDSLVGILFGGESVPHFRVDMPHEPADLEMLVEGIGHVMHTYASRAVLITYTDNAAAFNKAAERFTEAFQHVDFLEIMRVHDGRYFTFPEHPDDLGTAFDVTSSRVTVEAIAAGSAPAKSREALHLPAVASDELSILVAREAQRALRAMEENGRNRYVREQQDWVLERFVTRERLTDEELARFVVAAEQVPVRDIAWSMIDTEHKREWQDFWRDAAYRTCELTASVPALFAFASWHAGDGASAWIGVDRAREVVEDYSMASLIEQCLTGAVPPHTWTPVSIDDVLVEG